MVKDKVILGIDPGTNLMGFGCISCRGNAIKILTSGVIDLSKIPDHALKLHKIFHQVTALIDQFHPDELAIEAPFFGKNVQSMLKLGKAQGVAIAAALQRQVVFTEYAPRSIKQSITGNGNASKEQVAKMLQTLLTLPNLPDNLDETDGLAAAVCHHFQSGKTIGTTSYTGWKAFINANPGRSMK